jgi:hypothetical protein
MEAEFYGDLVNNFWVCDGTVLASRLPLPLGSPIDTGDQAIWHGVYTAMLALRFNSIGEGAQQQETYGHFVEAAKGLQLHQRVPGEAKPRLIRGWSDDIKTFQDDASNDSATGHLLGIYFGWKFGPATMQPVFAQLAAGLAAELHNHEDNLVGANGRPTTHGALVQGWKTDPLRLTLALAIYAVAATLTKENAFIQDYERLYRRYRSLIPYPKVRLWWWEKSYDTHRAAIHLAILADLTSGGPRQDCVYGLERMRRMVAKDGNVWVNELCKFGGYGWSPDDRDQALKVLSEFTLEDKMYNEGRDNYAKIPSFGDPVTGKDWHPNPILWDGKWIADQPIPRWAARSQDFFWQRNMRSLDAGSAGHAADSRLNCADWLCAYWLARHNGTLRDGD